MTSEEQTLLRYVCDGCENISCYFHIDKYRVIGSPHNCLYGTGCKWHPQIKTDGGMWVECSNEVLNSMLELIEVDR